jgi:hypothetical protein
MARAFGVGDYEIPVPYEAAFDDVQQCDLLDGEGANSMTLTAGMIVELLDEMIDVLIVDGEKS